MWGSGGRAPEGRKILKKFIQIDRAKNRNLIIFQNCHEIFARIWKKSRRLIENTRRPGGSEAEAPPALENFCDILLNYHIATSIFPKIRGAATRT